MFFNAINMIEVGTVHQRNIEVMPIIYVSTVLNYPVNSVPNVLLKIPAEIRPHIALTPWRDIWFNGSSISILINIFLTRTKRIVLTAPINKADN